ncbi:hypothetical protein KC19_6G153600 [Ceratodon purpureus]|uniref:Uncharacterized protein n=1 Tax=Ceratodon purpureus TaxID=3225 RepID=A0A8T0HHL1_CERPU|nr:hypothetical protein KC19_6G153600 [Ceratodon purpureus]
MLEAFGVPYISAKAVPPALATFIYGLHHAAHLLTDDTTKRSRAWAPAEERYVWTFFQHYCPGGRKSNQMMGGSNLQDCLRGFWIQFWSNMKKSS